MLIFIFPKKLQKKIEKSGIVIMELAGVPNQLEALNYLELSEGTFFDFFTKQQEDSIINWAIQELKMTENGFRNSFSKMKPFVVSQLATQIYFIGKTESYEVEIERIASDNKIEIKGLDKLVNLQELRLSYNKITEINKLMFNVYKRDDLLSQTIATTQKDLKTERDVHQQRSNL